MPKVYQGDMFDTELYMNEIVRPPFNPAKLKKSDMELDIKIDLFDMNDEDILS